MLRPEENSDFEELRGRLGDTAHQFQRVYRRWVLGRWALIGLFMIGSFVAVFGVFVWWPAMFAGFTMVVVSTGIVTRNASTLAGYPSFLGRRTRR